MCSLFVADSFPTFSLHMVRNDAQANSSVFIWKCNADESKAMRRIVVLDLPNVTARSIHVHVLFLVD